MSPSPITHVDLKVFGSRVDAAGGGVVAWEVVQCHMSDPYGVGEGDDQSALNTVECPAFPWKEHRVSLKTEEPESVKMEIANKFFMLRQTVCTCMTVRGLSDGYQRGKPNRVTHAERIRYVSEHLVLTTLAPR